ncbi:MAG: hypothetical protein AAF639_24860 [Chloroflexota bacterium]
MQKIILQHATPDLFSVKTIQEFYAQFPHEAVDPRTDDSIESALEERNVFIFSDSNRQMKGVVMTYTGHHTNNGEYAELGGNRIVPELHGFGLLTFEHYIRILSEIIKRIEMNRSIDELIFNVDTLSYLVQTGPKLRQLGFTHVPRTDTHHYPHIKNPYEQEASIYFVMTLDLLRRQISSYAKDFLQRIAKLAYQGDDLEGHWILLNHRAREESIAMKLELDILSDDSKLQILNQLAQDGLPFQKQ